MHSSADQSSSSLKHNLSHSRAAYLHAVGSLPNPRQLEEGPISQNGFVFTKESEIDSQLIELGWAFYCRYDACFEDWLKERGIWHQLQKKGGKHKISVGRFLKDQKILVPDELKHGLRNYKEIRNILVHNDGKNRKAGLQGTEKHLLPSNMELFFELFCWIETALGSWSGTAPESHSSAKN